MIVGRAHWGEHLIEITLPKQAALGHMDFRFSMHPQVGNPLPVQVTLLKQNSSGFGYRSKPKSSNATADRRHQPPPAPQAAASDSHITWKEANGTCPISATDLSHYLCYPYTS